MIKLKSTSLATEPFSNFHLLVMGLLTFWVPYVFVWFVLNSTYPRWFKIAASCWLTFSVLMLVYFVNANYRV